MKNYQRPQNNSRKTVVLSAVIVLSALVIVLPGLHEPLVNTFARTLTQESQAQVLNSDLLHDVTQSRADLQESISELEEENRRLRYENITADVLKIQNEQIKKELGRGQSDEALPDTTLGRVLSRPPITPYDTLMVDVGSNDGISVGQTVLASDSIEIGEVIRVYDHTSRVELYSSSGNRTPIEINEQGALYVAQGQGGGEINVNIPRNVDIEAGDFITTPSLNPRIIAEIKEVDVTETDPFIRARGVMPVNIFELTWVRIEHE